MRIGLKYLSSLALLTAACTGTEPPPEPGRNPAARAFEASETGIAMAGKAAITSPALSTNSYIDGAFLYFGDKYTARIPLSQINLYLDELKDLGIKEFVISSVRKKYGNCTEGTFDWHAEFPGKITPLLDAAATRNMHVHLGLVSSSDACPGFDEASNASQVKADTEAALWQLGPIKNHPALKGWYIPDEPGLGWPRFYDYHRGIVNVIRAHSPLPISVSPFLAGANSTFTPAEVADLALGFKNRTGIDVQMWQDSMGVDRPIDLGWQRPGSKGSLATYYAAISQKLGPSGMWATLELFNCCVPPFDGVSYTSAAIARVHNQLMAAKPEVAGKRFVWLQQYHMGTIDPDRKPEGARLKASYRALAGYSGKLVTPANYAWTLHQPDARYPDTDTRELFDRQTADPLNYAHSGWVGVNGNSEVTMDFGTARTVQWIGVHLLNLAPYGIRYPDSMDIYSSSDKVSWRLVKSLPFPYGRSDGEYVFGNQSPLNARARYFKIQLNNSAWTFASEVEVIAQ